MNYIKHLTGFFENIATNHQLNPTHISLYISIFQCWNLNRFQNPISINRDEIMRISKISSKSTYHKCMNDLHQYGYLKYQPSYNPFKGSLVSLIDFAQQLKPIQKRISRSQTKKQATTGTACGTAPVQVLGQALVSSINNTNITNNINEREACAREEKNIDNIQCEEQKKKNAQKKKSEELWPTLTEVQQFFTQQDYPNLEALKFFSHYQANGWLAGKAKIKDWKASADKWVLNIYGFTPGNKNQHLHTTTNKNYAEPL